MRPRTSSIAVAEGGADAAALERGEAARGRAARRGDLAAQRERVVVAGAQQLGDPAIVSVTSRAASGAGMPRRIAASTCASASSAQ